MVGGMTPGDPIGGILPVMARKDHAGRVVCVFPTLPWYSDAQRVSTLTLCGPHGLAYGAPAMWVTLRTTALDEAAQTAAVQRAQAYYDVLNTRAIVRLKLVQAPPRNALVQRQRLADKFKHSGALA